VFILLVALPTHYWSYFFLFKHAYSDNDKNGKKKPWFLDLVIWKIKIMDGGHGMRG